MEAAEKRLQNQENRGIKNPTKVMRLQKKAEERDRLQNQAPPRYDGEGGGLRVSIIFYAIFGLIQFPRSLSVIQ